MRPKNYVLERLPSLIGFYLFASGRLPYGNESGLVGWVKESLTLKAFKNYFNFVFFGFLGFGSI